MAITPPNELHVLHKNALLSALIPNQIRSEYLQCDYCNHRTWAYMQSENKTSVLLPLTMVHPYCSPKNSPILILLTDERSANHTCRNIM